MLRATDHAHLLIQPVLYPGAWAVDATVGNGHDTLFLAQQVGPTGRVFGFDIQAEALASARPKLAGLSHVMLTHGGHEHLARDLPDEAKGKLTAVMFNLGYLPGATKGVTTSIASTLSALAQALDCLAVGGRITLVLYPGHPGGAEEAAAVRAYADDLPAGFAAALCVRIKPLRPAPELLVIEKHR
jgi:SAM-dependent methyltransferase